MFHLSSEPRRPPLSDYKAQIERIAIKRLGEPVRLVTAIAASYYYCGVNAQEAAIDLVGD